MKCRLCGYKARDIAGMAHHYRKAHPRASKKSSPKSSIRSPRAMSKEELLAELARRL